MPGVNKVGDDIGLPEFSAETRRVRVLETTESLINIVRGVLAVRPLIDALEHPVSVFPAASVNRVADASEREQNLARLEKFLNRAATRIGAPQFKMCSDVPSSRHSVFELAVSQRLIGEHPGLGGDVLLETDAADEIIEEGIAGSFDREFFRAKLESFDGALLRVYAAGDRQKKAVLLVSACGMPAKLCERWVQLLGKDYFVITWESRLLFEEPANLESFAFDVNAQVSDLFAVMDHFGVPAAHLMGLCGGAVIAVSAAAARPERVSSLSLWHGDYELGPGCPKTKHQKDMKAFMSAAAMGRPQAEQIHKLFSQNTLKNFSSELAHLVLYPYANAELLYRYGKSNGNIMNTDVTPLLAKVAQPTLVVTSGDDNTAHPEGSKRVAELLPNARLQVVPHGDHLSLFSAAPDVTEIAMRFLALEGC
jgi:3-oxoadipate enol-lactonase